MTTFHFRVLFFLAGYLCSQSSVYDMALRYSLVGKFDISGKSSITVRGRILATENISRIHRISLDWGYGYQISENWRIAVHYQYRGHAMEDGFLTPMHRYYLEGNYTYPVNKFIELENRLMVQYTTRFLIFNMSDNGYSPFHRLVFRERAGINFYLSGRSFLYVQEEVLFPLWESPFELKRNRIYLGYNRKINSRWRSKWYLIMQSSLHARNNPVMHRFIMGWDMIYKWN